MMNKTMRIKHVLTVALLVTAPSAYASSGGLLFSSEDPQHTLNAQFKAYTMARTFVPGTLRNYRKQLIDTNTPLSKPIRTFVNTNIDWTAYAKSIFGTNWIDLTTKQRENFKALLQKVHIRKYGKHLSPDVKFSARFNKSTTYKFFRGEEYAKVSTIFVSHKRNIKFDIDFILRRGAKRWALCDVHVDGVSHSRVYRGHVKKIYENLGYAGVMEAFQRALKR